MKTELTRRIQAQRGRVFLTYLSGGRQDYSVSMSPNSARLLARELVVAADAAEKWESRMGAVSLALPDETGNLSLAGGGELSEVTK